MRVDCEGGGTTVRLLVPTVHLIEEVLVLVECGGTHHNTGQLLWYLQSAYFTVRTWCSLALTVSTTLFNKYSWYLPAILR